MSEHNSLAQRFRSIIGENLLDLATDRLRPIELPDWQVRAVRLRHSDADCSVPHLGEAATNLLDVVKVSLARCCSKSRQSDHSRHDIESANADCPLQCTNERLTDLHLLGTKEV